MLLIGRPSRHPIGLKQHLSSQLQAGGTERCFTRLVIHAVLQEDSLEKSQHPTVSLLTTARASLHTGLPSPWDAKARGPGMQHESGSSWSEDSYHVTEHQERETCTVGALGARAKVIISVALISKLSVLGGVMPMVRYSHPLW